MTIRALKLPGDFAPLVDLLVRTFQYPENPEWSIKSDEQEELAGHLKAFQKLWPLFRIAQLLVPSFRDGMRGHAWEEDGVLAAATIYHRLGATSAWDISTVGVLPDYRRRGFARQLLEETLRDIRARGGKQISLGVIAQNIPARSLYRSLGFEDFGGFIKYACTIDTPIDVPPIPSGYTIKRLKRSDWRTRYELERRITPSATTKYDPVTVGKARAPLLIRPLVSVLLAVRGIREASYAIRSTSLDRIVAIGGYSVPARGKGMCRIFIRLDPVHGKLAEFLIRRLQRDCFELNPGSRIEISIRHWMPDVIHAAAACDMERRVDNRRMGLLL
ncbi:GNAT family N-acetyltransferase [Candidatus Bipolaricaulota bacterium]